MSTTDDRLPYRRGPLYDLLSRKFPDHRTEQGVLDVRRLAADNNCSYQAAYKWFENNRISPKRAKVLVDLCGAKENRSFLADMGEDPLTIEDLHRFVFG